MADERRGEIMNDLFGSEDEESDEEREPAKQAPRRGGQVVLDDHDDEDEAEDERRSQQGRAQVDSDEDAELRPAADSDREVEEAQPTPARSDEQSDQEPATDHKKALKEAGLDSSEEDEEASPRRPAAGTPIPEGEPGGAREEDEVSEDSFDRRHDEPKEKPKGPPLQLEAPLQPQLADPSKVYVVRTTNILDIVPEEFDPETYQKEEPSVDETGKLRVKLDDNVVRWRYVRRRDGSCKKDSNARFVKWDDGSMHLIVGGEVLAVQTQNMKQDNAHLFLRHSGLGLVQGQGQLLQKMKMMPSSLDSKSHKRLTQLLDARHKKVYKVKRITTTMDPEKEKIERERLEEEREMQRASLARRQEREMRKFDKGAPRGGKLGLSSDYLEALEGEEEENFEDALEREAEAERRIQRAKREAPPPRPTSKRGRSPERPKSRRERLEEDSEDEEDMDYHEEDEAEEADEEEEEEEKAEEPREKRRKEDRKRSREETPPRKRAEEQANKLKASRRVLVSDDEDED